MPHNPLLFSSPLLVMITDTMGRIIFIHENMKQFLGHPVSDYMGMDIESVVGEITKKNPFTTSRYPDLKMIFPFWEIITAFLSKKYCWMNMWR